MKNSYLIIIFILTSCNMKKVEISEPKAEKINTILTAHGDDRIDEYYWLRERGNPKVIDYLNAENTYRDEYMKDYKSLYISFYLFCVLHLSYHHSTKKIDICV